MTTLFTRNLLKGMADGFTDAGAMLPFANDDLATGVFDKIAEDFGLPAVLEEHLPNDVYVKIGQQLLNSAKLAQETGYGVDAQTYALAKHAASMDLSDRALATSAFYMDKAAEEASLNGTGINTPESAAATNAIARLDQANRSSLQYLVGMGNTDMPEGGVIGRQMPHPMAPRGPSIHNSLSRLDKMAGSEDLSAEDMEMTPEERELLRANLMAQESEKVATAITFMEGLLNRGAPITGKTVLAAAVLADSQSAGLEVMASLVQHTKTAAELDHNLDEVMHAGGEHADPHLVQAIEHALAEHAGADVDHDEEPGDAEEHAEKAAGLIGDLYRKGRRVAKRTYEEGKEKLRGKAEKLKSRAEEAYERHTSPYVKEKVQQGAESISAKAREKAQKAKEKAKEKTEELRRRTGTETEEMHLRDARAAKGVKEKAKHVEMAGRKAVERAQDYMYDNKDKFKEKAKRTAATVGTAGVAGALAGGLAGADDDDNEKKGALLDFLKAAADGSLNEVEENTPEDAAHHNANAELDMENRSPDEYLEGAGESEMPNVGHRGASMAAPKGPARVNPDNTATRETKSAAFDYKVKAAAQFWGPKLPATMSQNEKRAHVIALAGMPADLQPGYVGSLYSR